LLPLELLRLELLLLELLPLKLLPLKLLLLGPKEAISFAGDLLPLNMDVLFLTKSQLTMARVLCSTFLEGYT
jgi:hypothetical protein